ncbi:hypothetical protein, partial [Actinocorallia lasiicapitis]
MTHPTDSCEVPPRVAGLLAVLSTPALPPELAGRERALSAFGGVYRPEATAPDTLVATGPRRRRFKHPILVGLAAATVLG